MRRIRRLVVTVAILTSFALAWGVPSVAAASHVHPFGPCPGVQVGC